ncbi:UPF0193 protein EVG1 homolog [Eumeta japonica]|uniref:UPF0193 protein EVG1 homolog n=1 Tax=Eumeta variegata TaxID=151549 RepID=A0A4C1VLI0_EUMVA|nr:UPF0193 protein EVG1 homolog [Eumeta japonica]
MLRPDSEGCVNVEWPSSNIPHGGIFHPKIVNYSKKEEEFLKVLLEESRLNILQRKKSDWELRQHEETSKQRHRPQAPLVRPRTSRRRSLSAIRHSGAFDIEE